MTDQKRYSDLQLYVRLLHQTRPYWGYIGVIFFINLFGIPLALLNPLPLKIAVDTVLESKPIPAFLQILFSDSFLESKTNALLLAAFLMIAITILSHLRTLATSLLQTYTGEKLVRSFQAQLFRHVQRLSLSYHDTIGTSDSVYRIQYDAPAIQQLAIWGLIPFITSTLLLISMMYVMFRLDYELTLIALAISPILFVVGRARKKLRRQSRQVRQIESASVSVMHETLKALRVVRAFGQEEGEEKRFVRFSTEGIRARIRLALVENGLRLALGVTTAFGSALVLYIGVRHVQSGTLTLGELLLIMGYISQLYDPLRAMSRRTLTLQTQLASVERAFSLLDQAPDVTEKPNAKQIIRAKGNISFCAVTFSYENDREVLKNISFKISSGTRVGIAGRTGAGKTTLVNLLTRFYDPTGGQILLDGIDLRDYKVADLRNQFGIALQEPILFSTSIGDNIAFARPSASRSEVIAAARAANAHDFIMNLSKQYETSVGEQGMLLSAGERQRISLARAFLKNAPVLILDEPTSSIDVATEAVIVDAMLRLMQDRTTFMIAHRLSTLSNCDLLMVLEEGELVKFTSDVSNTVDDILLAARLHEPKEKAKNL